MKNFIAAVAASVLVSPAFSLGVTPPKDVWMFEGETLQLAPGSTIGYSTVIPRAGDCIGYVVIRVNDDLMLVPAFQPVPGDTLPPEFEVKHPRNFYPVRDCRARPLP